MADDMDSDICVGFKRTITDIQDTQTLPELSNSPFPIPEQDTQSSETVSPLKQMDMIPHSLDSESSKKVKFSPHGQVSETHLEEIQEMVTDSVNEKSKSSDFVSGFLVSDEVSQESMENGKVGLVSDEKERVVSDLVDKQVEESVRNEVGFASMSTFVENKVFFHGKEGESQSSLEVKKKQLLEEVEAILGPAEKNPSVKSGMDSFKIEVIDETALIETVTVPNPGNACRKELAFVGPAKCVSRNGKQEMNGKKERTSRGKGKVTNHVVEAHSESSKDGEGSKIVFSRMELEAMRFVNVFEQRKLWKDIYHGLGPVVAGEYDNLASAKHQKNIHNNFDPRKGFKKMEELPGILGEALSENVDIELGNLINNETQDTSPLDPICSYSATDRDGYPFTEKECSEDDDSDEDYASIQRPAFVVEGEPNFESGSPEDGLEYLRRVRWEAARIPKVRVAKVDRSKFNREQSAYMPKIPEIAKCPEQLLPLKLWEHAFLAEFSELRLAMSRFEGSNASKSADPQSNIILHEHCYFHQLPGDIVFENFAHLKSKEIDFHCPDECSIIGRSSDQASILTTEDNNASLPAENFSPKSNASKSSSNSPLLSVILRMDSVARVSMLRKRIKAVKDMSTLSRNDCLWLFALCAVVDTPLDADTSASLRSLLRKCAALRAAKSILDDEVVMLNILATISGRYFGQSEN